MKQYISVKQAEKDLGNMYYSGVTWLEEHGHRDYHKTYSPDNVFMDIGMMIEFLGNSYYQKLFHIDIKESLIKFTEPDKICDALWSACVEVLNE